jgi:hypothetical protein
MVAVIPYLQARKPCAEQSTCAPLNVTTAAELRKAHLCEFEARVFERKRKADVARVAGCANAAVARSSLTVGFETGRLDLQWREGKTVATVGDAPCSRLALPF